MPARARTIGPEVSQRVAANIREARMRRGWEMPDLSFEMTARGYKISPAVINSIENGIISHDGEGNAVIRVRLLTIDESAAFAEVLGVPLEELAA